MRQCSALIIVVLAAKVGDEIRALLHLAASTAAARPIFVAAVSESQMGREWLEWLVSKDVNGYWKSKKFTVPGMRPVQETIRGHNYTLRRTSTTPDAYSKRQGGEGPWPL